jgi:hypothetical protein
VAVATASGRTDGKPVGLPPTETLPLTQRHFLV